MSSKWNWPGSRWWRVDLHAHSPASYDFGSEQDRRDKDWPAWVKAASDADLDAIAVADHNTPEGIPGLLEAARKLGHPVVFPGIELTAGGIHLLCIFDPSQGRDEFVALLGQLGIRPGAFGTSATTATTSIVDTLDALRAAGAITLAAHVNGPKGLIADLDGQERIKPLAHPGLFGVETAPPPADPAGWLDPTGPDVTRWVNGTLADVGRVLPVVQGSDGHAAAEVGRRFTWVKMTRPNLEGLRLALLDGSGSVRPATRENPGDPNSHAASVIECVTVANAKYMGRATALAISLNPWLNALIGGRGTGKSTLVDLCRLALRREAELNSGGETSLRATFDKRMRVPPGRSDEGLLTENTRVDVVYRKDGERFVISWDRQGGATSIARLDGERRIPEGGDIQERFPVRIYSQKQLFDLARDPNALLAVIDATDDVRGVELARLKKEAEAKYLSLCASARSLRAQALELPTRSASLGDIRRKIDVLQSGGHAATLNEYRQRQRIDAAWLAVQRDATQRLIAVQDSAQALAVGDLDSADTVTEEPARKALDCAHASMRAAIVELQRAVLAALTDAQARLAAVATGPDANAWREAVAGSEAAYKEVTVRLSDAGIANPNEYRDLLQRAASLEQEVKTLEQRQGEALAREGEAAEELVRFRALRSELATRRARFAGGASSALIRVEIRGCADLGGVEPFLRDTLGIVRYDDDHSALGERITAAGTAAAEWSYASLDAVLSQLRGVLADPQKQWPAKDRRFEAALRKLQPERLDRLALFSPEDSVEVSFRDVRDSTSQWRRLSQGSPGQQTAALLAFVLGYGTEPIILDQPEDDLDNTLIYELLVQRLRESKLTRQIIVVTHNPNIVVHGDAELVVSLESRGGQTQVLFAGGLQEKNARDEICRVMEGGSEAFDTRYHRIRQAGAQGRG